MPVNRFLLFTVALALLPVLAVNAADCDGQVLAPAPAAQPAAESAPLPSQPDGFYRSVVETLTAEALQGRRTGTAGALLARDFLVEALQTILIAEGVEGGQVATHEFDVTRGIRVTGTPRVELDGSALALAEQFAVAPFSGSGAATDAPLVFAGYGISAPELEWDDYANIDANGAVLIVVRGDPQAADATSRFSGDQPSVYSDLRRKASLARDKGAAAMLVVDSPLTTTTDELPEQRPTWSAANFDIPVLHVRQAQIEALLQDAGHDSLAELLRDIDAAGAPASFALEDHSATVEVQIERDLASGYNVYAIIPGTDPMLKHEYIVIGAHYDHLGIGGSDSLAPSEYGAIHPGADDNASGVAAALDLTARVAALPQRGRSVMVVLFDAEEIGVVGSTQFVKESPVAAENVAAMLNFDMVGRMKDNKLIVGGVGTAAQFEALLNDAAAGVSVDGAPLTLERDASGFGASDHMQYVQQGVPVLFFFTGAHEDYHRPSDTPDKLNWAGLRATADVAAGVLEPLLSGPRPEYIEVAPPAPQRSRGGLKVTLGTVPAYVETEVEGMAIGDVVPDGPAQRAGLQGGDVIVRIGDKKVGNIYDFMYALEGRNPGEDVEVAVMRDGAELVFNLTLGARNVEQ